jgi:hypothetical protein
MFKYKCTKDACSSQHILNYENGSMPFKSIVLTILLSSLALIFVLGGDREVLGGLDFVKS